MLFNLRKAKQELLNNNFILKIKWPLIRLRYCGVILEIINEDTINSTDLRSINY